MNQLESILSYQITKFLEYGMRNLSLLSVSCLLAVVLFYSRQNMDANDNSGFSSYLISHRGAAGLAPENTLAAIDSALFYQAQFIEIDIRQTKDSVLILMHDKDVNRTSSIVGNVHELFWSEIEPAQASSKNFPMANGHRIPRLEEALIRVKGNTSQLAIEVKDPSLYHNLDIRLIQSIQKHEMEEQVVIISFDHDFLHKVKAQAPQLKLGALSLLKPSMKSLEEMDFVSVYARTLRFFPGIIAQAHDRGIEVWAWTVNDTSQMSKLMEIGVDGITSDYPDRYKALHQLIKR